MGRPSLYPTKHRNLKRTTKKSNPGSTQYFGDFTISGTRYRPPLGLDEESARLELIAIMDRTRRLASGERDVGPFMLCEVQDKFVEAHSGHVEASTAKRWGVDDRAAHNGLGKETFIHELTTEKIVAWINDRHEATSPATANRSLTRLRQVLSWCCDRGWIEAEPTKGIRKFREPQERVRYLLPNEEDALLDVCGQAEFDWIAFGFLTGLRESEQLRLRWDQIHDGKIWLEGSGTKTHRRRQIPIKATVAAILERRPKGELVWSSPRGKVWSLTNFRMRFWLPLFESAGLENFTWHDLRHTFCSRLVQKGADLYRVSKLAGHRNITVTEKYAHLAPGNLSDTMDLLED